MPPRIVIFFLIKTKKVTEIFINLISRAYRISILHVYLRRGDVVISSDPVRRSSRSIVVHQLYILYIHTLLIYCQVVAYTRIESTGRTLNLNVCGQIFYLLARTDLNILSPWRSVDRLQIFIININAQNICLCLSCVRSSLYVFTIGKHNLRMVVIFWTFKLLISYAPPAFC